MKLNFKKTKSFFVWFYIIGIVGFVIPYTNGVFIRLIPWALLFSFALSLFFHEGDTGIRTITAFTVIYVASFILEALGVNTGFVFGHYEYGRSLGLKVLDTPVIIGLNWLMLAYFTGAISQQLKTGWKAGILAASFLMVLYDLILEHVAPRLDMWYWEYDRVPLQNYVVWFLAAVVIHALLKLFKVNLQNRIAPVIFFCQLAFLAVLWIYEAVNH